jgi:hypothetical protein
MRRQWLPGFLFAVALLFAAVRLPAYPPSPDFWEGVMSCEDTYISGINDCKMGWFICDFFDGPNNPQCDYEFGDCRSDGASTWSDCVGGLSRGADLDFFCEDARNRRDGCVSTYTACREAAESLADVLSLCTSAQMQCLDASGVGFCE